MAPNVCLVTADLLPAPRQQLEPAVPATSIHAHVVATRSAALMHQEQLTRQGSQVLGRLCTNNQQVFFDATKEGLELLSAAAGEDHQELVTKFFLTSSRHLAHGLDEQYLLGEAQVKAVTAAGLALNPPSAPSQPTPRRQVIEERNLTLSERLSGKAWFTREE